MLSSERRYDIDWLRVIAIGLLLIYHIAIGFQPWGLFIGFIQNSDSLESVWVPMSMLNVWRIPFLFFVSGMGVCFAISRRNWKALLKERAQRILIPFLFGMAAIVPLHVILWQDYYNQDMTYVFNPAHLWFLGNICVYVLVLCPVFFYLKARHDGKLHQFIKRLYAHPLGLLLIMLPFVAEAVIVNPLSFETYAMTWHGFYLGFLAFFFGFTFVYAGPALWHTIVRWRFILILLALGLYGYRLLFLELRSPNWLMSVESCLWIFSVMAFGHKHLNKNSQSLKYLSEAAYPVYILHMAFLYLAAWLVFPLDINVWLKFALSILITGAGCMLTYELLVKRVGLLRLLLGLKAKVRTAEKVKNDNIQKEAIDKADLTVKVE